MKMKVLVISDIHGSGYYAEKIKEINEKEKPEKIILLGDLYYHGPINILISYVQAFNYSNLISLFGKGKT